MIWTSQFEMYITQELKKKGTSRGTQELTSPLPGTEAIEA